VPIELLPDLVISQIAAGEVVERPASVVKELLENALDARAKTVVVEVQEGGKRLIRVSDDGTGIPSQEAMLAVARHATSKLKTADDLFSIRTLGFRGEALSSIVAVSQTTLTTRHRSEAVGVELHLEGGQLRHERGVGVPSGTVVTVENLFYNTPARLKFLKAESTEKRLIASLVMDYAMAYPSVRFTLLQDGREVFRTSGTGQLADVVVKVFGVDAFRQMIEVSLQDRLYASHDVITVRGYASLPSYHRNDRSRVVLFVNGRAVQDQHLMYAVTQAYHLLLEKGRYPHAVLMVDVPPEFVDVNVHPTKAEVRFQDANAVFALVQRAIREPLLQHLQVSPTIQPTPASPMQRSMTSFYAPTPNATPPTVSRRHDVTEMSEEDLQAIPEGLGRPQRPRTLPILRVVGQVGNAYIVAEGPAGVYLFDQHTCHERILHDDLEEATADGTPLEAVACEGMLVELSAGQMRQLEPLLEPLSAYGILLETFGTNALLVRGLPSCVALSDGVSLVQRLALVLPQGGDLRAIVLGVLSQVGAVKTGQALTQEEMQALIRRLERSPQPFTSPSGRQTLLHLSAEQLSKEFGKKP
jgi:DNA mismatch repair protein MutL